MNTVSFGNLGIKKLLLDEKGNERGGKEGVLTGDTPVEAEAPEVKPVTGCIGCSSYSGRWNRRNRKSKRCKCEIDEPVSQGGTGDCWILTGVLSLASTEVGKQIIKSSITANSDGSVTVTFKGIGVSYTISIEEIKKHDTDNIKGDAYSNGDNDMLVM